MPTEPDNLSPQDEPLPQEQHSSSSQAEPDDAQPEPEPAKAQPEPVKPLSAKLDTTSPEASASVPKPPASAGTGPAASGMKSPSKPVSDETALLHDLIGDPHLLTVVVLIGASALIPVPFLDDVAKAYLERRLFRTVAEREKMTLSSAELDRLTKEPASGCCALGCLGNAVLYPVKRVLRKIFFFLEIKRSVDQSSTALAEAWLFALTLRRGLWSSGRDKAQTDLLRDVIETACHSHGVKPLETAFHHVFQGAKGTLIDFANRFTGKRGDNKEQLDAAMSKLQAEESERLSGLSNKLNDALSGVSDGYLERFALEFEKQLKDAQTRPRPVA